jgi:DNA-binding response OmpR family regulator
VTPTTVVVISPSSMLGIALSRALSTSGFHIVPVRPGPGVLDAVRRERPRIAVIDRIDERPEAAQLEIALLKTLSPDVQIIAVSDRSSEVDAAVIEQGIFYYAVDASSAELVQLINAAERSRSGKGEVHS